MSDYDEYDDPSEYDDNPIEEETEEQDEVHEPDDDSEIYPDEIFGISYLLSFEKALWTIYKNRKELPKRKITALKYVEKFLNNLKAEWFDLCHSHKRHIFYKKLQIEQESFFPTNYDPDFLEFFFE